MSKRNAQSSLEEIPNSKESKPDLVEEFMKIADKLNFELDKVQFLNKIDYVYNPTKYARLSYERYILKYCNTHKKVMFLGMNPGPWGMSQTGVPFGEVATVRDWLQIQEPVSKPNREHPTRPVSGFSCQKSEVSGKRFWSLIKELCIIPSNFFTNCFVYNYLPLQFINSNGKNLPPTSLKLKEQEELFNICDRALLDCIELYKVELIVAVGKFAETRANAALKLSNKVDDMKVVCILHPSPQSKAANNWHVDAHKQFRELGIVTYFIQ